MKNPKEAQLMGLKVQSQKAQIDQRQYKKYVYALKRLLAKETKPEGLDKNLLDRFEQVLKLASNQKVFDQDEIIRLEVTMEYEKDRREIESRRMNERANETNRYLQIQQEWTNDINDQIKQLKEQFSKGIKMQINQAVDISVNRSINSAVSRSIDSAVSRSIDSAVSRSIDSAVSRSIDNAVSRSVNIAVRGAVTELLKKVSNEQKDKVKSLKKHVERIQTQLTKKQDGIIKFLRLIPRLISLIVLGLGAWLAISSSDGGITPKTAAIALVSLVIFQFLAKCFWVSHIIPCILSCCSFKCCKSSCYKSCWCCCCRHISKCFKAGKIGYMPYQEVAQSDYTEVRGEGLVNEGSQERASINSSNLRSGPIQLNEDN